MKIKWTGFFLLFFSAFARAEDQPAALVKTETMRLESVNSTLSAYGAVISDPETVTSVSLPRSGQITRLDVATGKKVRKGGFLLEFATDPDAAYGYAAAKTSLEMARTALESTKRLYAHQLATNMQLEAAEKAYEDAESAFDAQKKLGTGLALEDIDAPFDGVVTALYSSPGDRIPAGKAVLQISRLDDLLALIGVQPEDAPEIKAGMRVLLFPVFGKPLKLQGMVSEVKDTIDPRTHLVDMLVKIEKPQHLIPGMKLKGEIVIPAGRNWVVPRSAVLSDEKGAYIFQDDKGHARRVGVTATEYGEMTAIQGKFDPDLPVIVLGNYELKEGMKLREGTR